MISLAQERSNLRLKWIPTSVDSIALDSLSIVPGTFLFSVDEPPVQEDYLLDEVNAILVWTSAPQADSVQVSYRVLPMNLSESVNHKSLDKMLNEQPEQIDPYVFRPA